MKYDATITFEEFLDLIKNHYNNIKYFYNNYIVFYEAGAWGLGDCDYGFKTSDDLQKYHKWLEQQKENE